MKLNYLKHLKLIPVILFISNLLAFPASAETDSNPNSPTPILLSVFESRNHSRIGRIEPPLDLRSRIDLFVTNLELMNGEGATAFRVYIGDVRSRQYIFPVSDLRLFDSKNRIYTFSIELKDETIYRKFSKDNEDILISVAWRGLESNRVRLNSSITVKEKSAILSAEINPQENETNYVGYRWSGDRIRFLEQATFGPTAELDLRVRRIGLRTWLTEQFELPYPSESNPYPDFSLKPTTPTANCNGLIDGGSPDPDPFCYTNHYTMYPVQNWFYREAFYSKSQLRHRVAWALAQLWVVSGVETQQSRYMTEYHKVLSRNAFGNWRTLMKEMTLNPGMGNYLNMRTSTKYSRNENFAREILQLFNVGLFMLNQDGTLQLDENGEPIPTYDQEEVNNFTSTLTGWSLCERGGGQCPNRVLGAPNYIDPMILTNPNNHDLSEKTLLKYPGSEVTETIPACTGCEGTEIINYADNSLNQALDNIYNHPNVAPFVSRFLIQQLITGDPTPAYVGRVAEVFNVNRNNPTQLKEVIKAILLDPEARGDAKTDPHYGKLREPVLFLTNIARLFGVRSADRSGLSDGVLTEETKAMGQIVFMSPSVFNYYPPDYTTPGTTFNGPEFALFNTVTSISRINFANKIIFDRINTDVNRRVTDGTSISLTNMRDLAEADPSGNRLMNELNSKMMHGTMSWRMRETIRQVILTVPSSDPLLRAQRAVYLVATSTQYQVQR